jgi:Gylcosyl hydrolase family 115 C-terminal domain/Bacterial Ig-like domain
VVFSEVVTTVGGVSLAPAAGGAAVPAAVSLSGSTVTITPNAPLANSTQYRITVPVSVTDVAGNPLAAVFTSVFTTAAVVTGPVAYNEVAGQVVFEAEGFDANVTQGGKSWAAVAGSGGASGQYMVASPNTGSNVNASIQTTSPRLDYQVRFATPGTYQVWLRSNAANDQDNSIHLGVNGVISTTVTLKTYNSVLWSKTREGSATPATITIPAAGVYTINVWMREDGYNLDRFLLTNNAALVPSGVGPATSTRS